MKQLLSMSLVNLVLGSLTDNNESVKGTLRVGTKNSHARGMGIFDKNQAVR